MVAKGFKKLLAAIPFVNFVAQFFFVLPDVETVTKLLDILGLLSALLLVVVYAVPGTVDYEELGAADLRFGWTPDRDTNPLPANAYSVWWDRYFSTSPSYMLGAAMTIAGFCFSVVFFGVIFQYVYVGFAKAMIRQTKKEFRTKAWRRWYICNAFITIAMLLLLIVAMVAFYLGIYILCVIKWPDLGLALVQMMETWYDVNIAKASTVYTDLGILNAIVPVAVAVILVLGGLGNYFIYSNLLDHEDPGLPNSDIADAGELEVHEKTNQRSRADATVYPESA